MADYVSNHCFSHPQNCSIMYGKNKDSVHNRNNMTKLSDMSKKVKINEFYRFAVAVPVNFLLESLEAAKKHVRC